LPRLRAFRWQAWAEWTEREVFADRPNAIAIDTETSGLGFHDLAFCATLSWRGRDGSLKSGYVDLEAEDLPAVSSGAMRAALLHRILSGVPRWVFWNSKFDLQKLDYLGALPPLDGYIIEDGQPIAALLNENRRMALKVRAVEDLGHVGTVEVEVKSGPRKGQMKKVAKEEHQLAAVRRKLKLKKEDGYHLLPREALIPYALKDTELTLRWWEKFRPLLPPDLEPVYAEEIEVMRVLLEMESNGIGIDVPYLTEAGDEWGAKVMTGWQELVDLTGREDFNPNSPIQLTAAFEAAGVSLESTDKAAMRDLLANEKSPPQARALAEALHEYRSAEKVYGTYLRPLLAEQRDGIAHPWFNSVGPRTGRTSSSTAAN
jgi:hypothetical protein